MGLTVCVSEIRVAMAADLSNWTEENREHRAVRCGWSRSSCADVEPNPCDRTWSLMSREFARLQHVSVLVRWKGPLSFVFCL